MRLIPNDAPDLMTWFIPWLRKHEGTDLIYYKSASNQVQFIRDEIAPLILPKVSYDERPEVELAHPDGGYYWTKCTAFVMGTHTSKSCEIPVYGFERPDLGLTLIMRGNFYNWKLSVVSETPIELPQLKVLSYTEPPREPDYTGDCLSSCYFEGFDSDWCFGYYEEDHRKFSMELYGRNALWTTIFMIMHHLGDLKERRQHTKLEHRKELDENSARSKVKWDADKVRDTKLKEERAAAMETEGCQAT
jgi:hypothetical protein